MRLLKQMQRNDCLLFAFAMALGEDPINLLHEVGPCDPEYGYHWQSFVDACLVRDIRVVEIQHYPTNRDGDLFGFPESRFEKHLDNTALGVVITADHALAFNGKAFFDPKGFVIPKSEFDIPIKAILQIKSKNPDCG